MHHWFNDTAAVMEALHQSTLGGFPKNYLVVDTETTGVTAGSDLITQVGWAVVRDNQVVDNGAAMLDWTRHSAIDQDWLRAQLAKVAEYFRAKGVTMHFPYERLHADGGVPEECLQAFVDLVEDHVAHNEFIVGHNMWYFDRRMIDANVHRFLGGHKIPWQPNSILDTGLIEKAAQMNRPPFTGETLDGWFRRIYSARVSIKWNLEHHCVNKYKLFERHPIDAQMAHDAGYDALTTHWLLEAYGALMRSLCV